MDMVVSFFRDWIRRLLHILLVRYLISSVLSLSLDVAIYSSLYHLVRPLFVLQFVASTCGMLLNFWLQHTFVFLEARRSVSSLFFWSTLSSIVGIFMGSVLIEFFHRYALTSGHPIFNKCAVVGIVFFYNFVAKRLIFSPSS